MRKAIKWLAVACLVPFTIIGFITVGNVIVDAMIRSRYQAAVERILVQKGQDVQTCSAAQRAAGGTPAAYQACMTAHGWSDK